MYRNQCSIFMQLSHKIMDLFMFMLLNIFGPKVQKLIFPNEPEKFFMYWGTVKKNLRLRVSYEERFPKHGPYCISPLYKLIQTIRTGYLKRPFYVQDREIRKYTSKRGKRYIQRAALLYGSNVKGTFFVSR